MLPLELINIIFAFAFYPHEMPSRNVQRYNKCVENIPRKRRANRAIYMYYSLKAGASNPWYYGGQTHWFYDPGLSPYLRFEYHVDYLGRTWTIKECTTCEKSETEYLDGIVCIK